MCSGARWTRLGIFFFLCEDQKKAARTGDVGVFQGPRQKKSDDEDQRVRRASLGNLVWDL